MRFKSLSEFPPVENTEFPLLRLQLQDPAFNATQKRFHKKSYPLNSECKLTALS